MKKIKALFIISIYLSLFGCNQPDSATEFEHPARTFTVFLPPKNLVADKTIKVGNAPEEMTAGPNYIYISNNNDKTISIIDTSSDEVVKTLTVDSEGIYKLLSFHDGKNILAIDSKEGKLLVFDPLQGNKLLQSITLGKTPDKVKISDDNTKVFISFKNEEKGLSLKFTDDRSKLPLKEDISTEGIFNLNDDNLKTITELGLSPKNSIKYEKKGLFFITMAGSNEITVIDYSRKTVLTKFPAGNSPDKIYLIDGLKANTSELWIGNNAGNIITVIDPDYLLVKARIKIGEGNHNIIFSGNKAYISNMSDGTVSEIDRINLNTNIYTGPNDFVFVKDVITRRCTICHSITPTHTDHEFKVKHEDDEPAGGIAFDTPEQMKKMALRIKQRAVIEKTMPLDNISHITEEERDLIGKWVDAGAPIN